MPENFYDTGKSEIKGKEFRALFDENAAFRAAAESKRLSLPQAADQYKAALPGDFKPPEGVSFELKADDPLMAQARAWAHKSGLTQEQFSEALGLFAGSQVASQQQVTAARNAEVAKLGATGPARVDALGTFFKAYLGEAEGKQVMSRVFTASDVAIMEKLVGKITTQGSASFNGTGREPPEQQGRLNAEQIGKLSQAERLDYSRRFDQSKMPAWQDPRGAAA